MKQIGFGVYDWEKSPWVNSRDESKRVSMRAARKANVWRKELPTVEISYNGRVHSVLNHSGNYVVPATSVNNSLQTPADGESRIIPSSYKVVKYGPGVAPVFGDGDAIPYVVGQLGPAISTWDFRDDSPEYEKLGTHKITDTTSMKLMAFKEVEFIKNHEAIVDRTETFETIKILVDGVVHEAFSGYADGGCVVEYTTIEANKTNYLTQLQSEHGASITDSLVSTDLHTTMAMSSPEDYYWDNPWYPHTISNIDMLPFLEAYQTVNTMTDADGNSVTFGAQKTAITALRDHVESEDNFQCIILTSSWKYGNPDDQYSISSYWYEERMFRYHYTDSKGYYNYTPCSTGFSISLTNEYPAVTNAYDSLVVNPSDISKHSVEVKTYELLDSSTQTALPYEDMPVCLLRKMLEYGDQSNNLFVFEPDLPTAADNYDGFQKHLAIDKANLILLCNDIIDTLTTIEDEQSIRARDTEIGKILYQFGNLDSILDTDTSKMDEFYMSFHIANFDNINNLEDSDTHTDVYQFQYMVDSLATSKNPDKWREYFHAIIHGSEHYCLGYVPDWVKIRKAPPWVFQTVLTACMRLEYGVPKPKHKTNWFSVIVAVIIIVIVSVATWGSGASVAVSAFGQFMAAVTIASSVLMIGYELTGNEKMAKTSKILGYVAFAYNLLKNGITGLIDELAKSMLSTYQLVMTAITMGLTASYKHKLDKKIDKIRMLEEKVDGVNERIANEHLDKLSKIQKFMHGEHITTRYTYQYDTPYNEPYEEK